MNDLINFFNGFLETINYPDEKQKFIDKFVDTIYGESIEQILKTLPEERQAVIRQTLESAKTPELLEQAFKDNFDQTLFTETLQKTSQKLFEKYLQTIDEVLTADQKLQMQTYFSSLKPQS